MRGAFGTWLRLAGSAAALAACVSSCGGGVTNGGTGGSTPNAGAPTPASMQGQVTRNDAGMSDSRVAYSVTLTMSDFTVAAGSEVFKCQDFANPFEGQDVDVSAYDLMMNAGSHHMILFYLPGASNGPLVDCPEGGLKQGPFTFGAQSQRATQTYPPGVGAAIPRDMGFTMNAHYVNATSASLAASVAVTMTVAAPGVVTQHAGGLQFVLVNISIPPTGQPVTVTGSCKISQDMSLLWTGSHMHQRATRFVSTSGANKLYETDQWEDPPSAHFSPPLPLQSGADITWSCTYVNDTASTLTFGQSALTNAMCNANGAFYPVQDVRNPLISCLQ